MSSHATFSLNIDSQGQAALASREYEKLSASFGGTGFSGHPPFDYDIWITALEDATSSVPAEFVELFPEIISDDLSRKAKELSNDDFNEVIREELYANNEKYTALRDYALNYWAS